jgi:hypothetical protein
MYSSAAFGSATSTSVFTYNAPGSVSLVTPAAGPLVGNIRVTITVRPCCLCRVWSV